MPQPLASIIARRHSWEKGNGLQFVSRTWATEWRVIQSEREVAGVLFRAKSHQRPFMVGRTSADVTKRHHLPSLSVFHAILRL